MTSDLLWQGLELMFVGMGTVFVFLTLLVLATAGMSRLILRWQRDDVGAPTAGSGDPDAEVAAIAAAIALHRRQS